MRDSQCLAATKNHGEPCTLDTCCLSMNCKRPYLDQDGNNPWLTHSDDDYQENEMDYNHRSDDHAKMRLNFYLKRNKLSIKIGF